MGPSLASVTVMAGLGSCLTQPPRREGKKQPVLARTLNEDTSGAVPRGGALPGVVSAVKHERSNVPLGLPTPQGNTRGEGVGPREVPPVCPQSCEYARQEGCSAWPFHMHVGAAGGYDSVFWGSRVCCHPGSLGIQVRIT